MGRGSTDDVVAVVQCNPSTEHSGVSWLERQRPAWSIGQWWLAAAATFGAAIVASALLLYNQHVVFNVVHLLLARVCSLLAPLFVASSAFLLLALALRRTWTSTGIYLTLCGGIAGEAIGLFLSSSTLLPMLLPLATTEVTTNVL